MTKPGAVVVISSHVARGSVGNRAAVFALERLGFEVWAVPTILLPHHPGHGAAQPIVPDDPAFAALLDAILDKAGADGIAAILSGYLASPGQAQAVARLVTRVRAVRPEAIYLCDPIIGDAGRLYVGQAVAAATRDVLLPLADAATPNAFECAWLSGAEAADAAALGSLAAALPPPVVLVTSAPALMRGHIGNLLVQPGGTTLLEHRAVASAAKGTGDLLAALLLGRRLEGHDWSRAAELAVASVFEVVAGTAKLGADELALPALQQALARPRAPVNRREIGASRPRATETRVQWVAGVDGCPAGWIAVFLDAAGQLPPRRRVFARFADLLEAPERPARIAVDMPIGLPETIVGPGRAAEIAVRPLLGDRQSSVFSVPARAAVMRENYPEACRVALETSAPPRKISRQGFALFPKIRELDAVLTPQRAAWIVETHPEVAFAALNGDRPMALPKKLRSRANPAGLEERIALLERLGIPAPFLREALPARVGRDDLIDAAVAALVALRHLRGEARPYPDPPERDARGLPIAIWA